MSLATSAVCPARAPRGSVGLQPLLLLLGLAAFPPVATPLTAQTIRGTLMDLETGQPIDLGLVMMFTESGDSVDMTVSDASGRFSLSSPTPGSFLLLASALGYDEAPAGVFELGPDGVMDVEYRLEPMPLPLDGVVVSLNRPVLQHRLVRNGFVRRLQRGFGHFITPHDIEESSAGTTEELLVHVPGVRVADVRVSRGGVVLPRSDIGQTVQTRAPGGGWCTPTVYVDGIRTFYTSGNTSPAQAATLSTLAPLATLQAIEVYRRPAEIPVEYPAPQAGGAPFTNAACGVLVLWTGSRPVLGAPIDRRAGGGDELLALPAVDRLGPPPRRGETIRVDVEAEARERLGLASPWEGTFLMVRGSDLIANDGTLGRAVAVPTDDVYALQVRRDRDAEYAVLRGAVAGTAFAFGMGQFLKILCRSACEGGLASPWFPAALTGAGLGVLVGSQGPGQHWVEAPLPPPDPSSAPSPGSIRRRR